MTGSGGGVRRTRCTNAQLGIAAGVSGGADLVEQTHRRELLLRHYLEPGTSKSALARQLGVSRDTVHRWIRDGHLDRDLEAEPVQYGPRPPVPTKLDAAPDVKHLT
jgi:DNA invertase Pin-like site-specific DNA recombinase